MFSKGFFLRVVKSRDCVVELNNFWLVKPNGIANQKFCFFQVYSILESKTKNVLKHGGWIWILYLATTVESLYLEVRGTFITTLCYKKFDM